MSRRRLGADRSDANEAWVIAVARGLRVRRLVTVAVAALGVAMWSVSGVAFARSSVSAPFLAPAGCAMAHCDQALSDNSAEAPPTGPVTALWHDTSVVGSSTGLGCSSNATVAACSLTSSLFKSTTLKVYSASGSSLWSSKLLSSSAYYSAPIVDPNGGVIAADNSKVVRYTPTGQVAWQTKTPGGTPISPVLTDDGTVILATLGGPVSAYDAATGTELAATTLSATVNVGGVMTAGYYDTINTPAVNGNRVYISTQFRNTATNKILPYGRLYALDFTRTSSSSGQFTVAWTFDFQAPSGGSPTVIVNQGVPTIYFDGNGVTPGSTTAKPQLFAVEDLGTTPQLLWKYAMPIEPQAAAAQDPRGGVWTFSTYSPNLVRLDPMTGAVLQTINVDTLLGQPGVQVPSSAMTITGSPQEPVMIVSATPVLFQSSYICAIDLLTSQLLWSYRVDQSKGIFGVGFGQFPIMVRPDGSSEVVFSTDGNGVWGLAGPPVTP